MQIDKLRDESVKYHKQIAQLNAQLHTAFANEQKLKTTLAQLTDILATLEDSTRQRHEVCECECECECVCVREVCARVSV